MKNKKNYLIFFLIFIIFSTYSPKNSFKNNIFSINEIVLLKKKAITLIFLIVNLNF